MASSPDSATTSTSAAELGRFLVIIPAFNEEIPLPAVLATLRESVPEADVVVIDDGSKDRTAQVAAAGGAQVLQLPYNLGIGGAQIRPLLAALEGGADLVIGSRFAEGGGEYDVGRFRGGAMALLRWMVRRSTGTKFTDTSSGFRAFSAPMLRFFADNYPAEYMESVEALLRSHRHGFTVIEIPTTMNERAGGQASNRNVKLIYHFIRLLLVVSVADRRAPTAAQEVRS